LCLACCLILPGCGQKAEKKADPRTDMSGYLSFLDSEPVLADPHRTSEKYTVVLNVFDRLVEEKEEDGRNRLVPSLADSWEISPDGLVYTFRLHPGVTFSNGAALTAEDVGFTLQRLIAHPESRNRNLAMSILGAEELRSGKTDKLAGFKALDDHSFTITLAYPCATFLEGLTTPGASILDKETTLKAGNAFGQTPNTTIGTGPFVLTEWKQQKGIIMKANPKHWAGPPKCDGLNMRFYAENSPLRQMFLNGELDILDLDKLGIDAEYFLKGDIYRKNLIRGHRVGISYIALNQSVRPLQDVRVRQALQLALDRRALLHAAISNRGVLENGIFPRGLKGYNPALPELPFDPEKAKQLLQEAGYGNGFDLTVGYSAATAQRVKDMLRLTAAMWKKVGVRASLLEMDNRAFLERRRKGELACYTGTWSADFNDPDNFISEFFGSRENTLARSLCYPDQDIMKRIRDARSIVDPEARIREYQALEKRIVQEDAAWIPLYSGYHFFMVNDRVKGFHVRWNGWSSNRYADVAVKAETARGK
jgi:ABC-type transport system substrate-binding protein